MSKFGYGVDLGGTTAKIGRFSDDGTLIEKWSIRTDVTDGGSAILNDIADTIKENMEASSIASDDVIGIGMGVPGSIEADRTTTCVNLGWKNVPAEKILSELTGLYVITTNDAMAASLGETWKGSGKGYPSIMLITLGTGLGCGIVINGKSFAGKNGAAGELGHIPVNIAETRQCNCGGYGCLEQYASATGNARLANDYLAECDEPSPLRTGVVNSKRVWDLTIEGDPVATEISERFCEYLGRGLAIAANIVDPHAILLGGGVARTGEPLRKMTEKYYKKYVFGPCKNTPILLAELGNDAGIYGCMYLLLNGD